MAGAAPYSIRRLLSSQVLRALLQMLAWQLIGASFLDSTTKPDWYPFGTIKVSGPFCASADSPVPLHVFPVSETEIDPFSVWTRTFPLLPSTLIGPFTALMSASPEKFFKLIGPFWAWAVSLPFTSYREIGPFIVLRSMEEDFGARISKYTVQSSSSAGPLVDTLPFSVDMVICERIRSVVSPDPAAALHAVTEYVSLSQPTTCRPPFSCG